MQATTETMFVNYQNIFILSILTTHHVTQNKCILRGELWQNQSGDKNSALELKFSENWLIIYCLLNINQYLLKGKNYFQLCISRLTNCTRNFQWHNSQRNPSLKPL